MDFLVACHDTKRILPLPAAVWSPLVLIPVIFCTLRDLVLLMTATTQASP